ncbi:MAG: hypothetical protein ACOYOB_12950 [Myxococcota bacterium]
MAVRFTLTKVLPFALLYAALLGVALLLDLVLHKVGLVWIGRYLGLVGVLTIGASFAYSLRKRGWIRKTSAKSLLSQHETLGWSGAVMIVVHGGVHFNAWIPWLALGAMLVVVASGMTGQILLKQARDSLKEKAAELRSQGLRDEAYERELLAHSLLVGTLQRWRAVHMPLTMVFVGLATLHVLSTLLLGSWR